uniref:Uncharacterized protein n=1 Tax=Ditylenchus dipsaci TaxID=166011 RepID=A0A915D302_9BILA
MVATTTKKELSEGRFRMVVLVLGTACLSMMLANILTLNFTILCMTEGKYRWDDFTIDLGIDVFERVDWERRTPKELPEVPQNVEIPGIRMPSPGFNWQSFRLARQNPQLFLRLMKTIIVEVSERVAVRLGEKLDPRNIDFSKFRDGFNLTDINEDVVLRVKDYILRKVQYARFEYERFDAEGRNISVWKNVTLDDVELHNITWNGSIPKALLFAIVAVGALLAIAFVSFSIEKFGCRKTFTVVGLISALSTALCPLAASIGFIPFVIARLFQGVGLQHAFRSDQFYTAGSSYYNANVRYSVLQLARLASVYYLHALLTAVLMAVWWLVYRDSPSESKHVSIAELRKLQAGKVIDGRKRHNRPSQCGLRCSSAYLFQFGIKMFAGMLSDRIRLGETAKVRIFNSIAFVGMATFLVALAIVPVEHHVLALLCIIMSVSVLGFNTGGFFKSATLVGRQYAYFVNTNVQIIMCVAMLTVPFVVYSLTPNNAPSEWSTVFVLHAILLVLCNKIFCLLGSGLPAPFTQQQDGQNNTLPHTNSDQMKPIIKDGAVQPSETTKLATEDGRRL